MGMFLKDLGELSLMTVADADVCLVSTLRISHLDCS